MKLQEIESNEKKAFNLFTNNRFINGWTKHAPSKRSIDA